MKTEKVIWGLILVFAGGIILLQNLEIVDFNWHVIFRFWPLVLILIGANLLFSGGDSSTGSYVSLALTFLVLGFIAYQGITTTNNNDSYWSYGDNHDGDDDDDETTEHSRQNVFSEEFNDSIVKAVLNISGGATQYIIADTTSSLFEANANKNFGNFSLLRTTRDSAEVLDFKMKGHSEWKLNESKGNKAVLKLNTKPIWDINIELGAGATKFDLSSYKINNIHIEGGAASFQIKLGQPIQNTNVSVETGVSKIEISIPSSAACKINVESGLSSNNFEGFIKEEDGSFVTKNYKEGTKAIILDLEGGLSKFEVTRY